MSTTLSVTPTAAPPAIAATIARLTAEAEPWLQAVQEHFTTTPAPTTAELDPFVQDFSLPALTDPDGLLTGAGFVATPGVLADSPWHLAWWLRRPHGPERLAFVADPRSEMFRDYTMLEWWRLPARSGRPHLTGPYVDYVCTDDYTVTYTAPVYVNGELVGVVGWDSLVDRLERELLPTMRAVHGVATVINSSGRVVTSTDTRRDPGSMLRLPGLSALRDVLASPDTDITAQVLAPGVQVLTCGDAELILVIES
ncbi:cache domain-containing protein [Microbacterium gorillae]|uniref:cache domain-containing protein n=1 Tax=Microbacterium gorillae TaxID=1231063 RepID=UPI00069404F2|nr:cache domain-containing protein [Microbacterium gorillae]